MTRRFIAALVVVVAVLVQGAQPAAASHSSDPIITGSGDTVHWMQSAEGGTVQRNGRVKTPLERIIHVIVPSDLMANVQFADAMRHAVTEGDRSPYIDMVLDMPAVAPTECPDTHCITVYRQSMNGAVASMGWDPQGHMYGRAVTVGFDINDGDWLYNAACHEIAGHGLGLAHSSDGSQGPCVVNLTDHDLNLIDTAHAHKDSKVWGATCFSWGCPTSTSSLPVKKVIRHSREFYENLGK
jgi:hypothetical protein